MQLRKRNNARHDEIAALVRRAGFVRVRDLSEHFDVSTVTIRSDLEALEAAGALRRIRGGALSPGQARQESPFELTREEAGDAKTAIGRAACRHISAGDVVLLDVGSTTAAIADELIRRTDLDEITVLTNSLTIALDLERAEGRISVIVTGGTVRRLQHSMVDPLATKILEGITAHLAFIGCNGVHAAGGVTNINLPEAVVKQSMVSAARRRVVVADGSKVGEVELVRVCGVDAVDLLITDRSADVATLKQLSDAGLAIEVAELAGPFGDS